MVGRTTIAATLGGLSAKATGGDFQQGAYQAAMVHLFNKEAGNKKPIPISDEERSLVKNGAREEFWKSRELRGDPFAPVALDVVNNEDWGRVANILGFYNNEELGVNLMHDYVDWVDNDYSDSNNANWRGILSRDQIDNWHHHSFDRTPGWQFYGGSGLDFIANWYVCSYGCDAYTPR